MHLQPSWSPYISFCPTPPSCTAGTASFLFNLLLHSPSLHHSFTCTKHGRSSIRTAVPQNRVFHVHPTQQPHLFIISPIHYSLPYHSPCSAFAAHTAPTRPPAQSTLQSPSSLCTSRPYYPLRRRHMMRCTPTSMREYAGCGLYTPPKAAASWEMTW